MPDFTVRVFQVQLLCGSADVPMTDVTPERAAEIVLAAVEGDPDDDTGERRYRLPDGRFIPLDPEDCVVGGRIYCQVLDGDRRIVGLFGDLTSCDTADETLEPVEPHLRALPVGLPLNAEEADVMRSVLNDEIIATASNAKAELLTAVLRKLPRP